MSGSPVIKHFWRPQSHQAGLMFFGTISVFISKYFKSHKLAIFMYYISAMQNCRSGAQFMHLDSFTALKRYLYLVFNSHDVSSFLYCWASQSPRRACLFNRIDLLCDCRSIIVYIFLFSQLTKYHASWIVLRPLPMLIYPLFKGSFSATDLSNRISISVRVKFIALCFSTPQPFKLTLGSNDSKLVLRYFVLWPTYITLLCNIIPSLFEQCNFFLIPASWHRNSLLTWARGYWFYYNKWKWFIKL